MNKEEEEKIRKQITDIFDKNDAKRRKNFRRTLIANGVLAGVLLVLFTTLAIVSGDLAHLLGAIAPILWIGLITMLQLHIEEQHFVINQLVDLQELEHKVLDEKVAKTNAAVAKSKKERSKDAGTTKK